MASTEKLSVDTAKVSTNRILTKYSIVQDWHYWGDLSWGPQWDSKLYPDPAGMVAQLHKQNFHFMISVWSRFDNSTTFYAQMRDIKALVGRSDYYGSNVGLRGLTFRNTC